MLQLTTHKEKPVSVKDEKRMFSLIRAAFGQRRKTLVNCLRNAEAFALDKDRILEALASLGISEQIRGEALTLRQFAALSDALTED